MKLRTPENAERICAIYALVDPRDGRERYVGKTVDPSARLRQHISDAARRRTPLHAWIRKICREGAAPVMRVIRWVPESGWRQAEKDEIAARRGDLLLRAGFLNLADGGDEPACSLEQRRANGLALNAALRDDTVRKRIRTMKAMMMTANAKGQLNPQAKAHLRAAARNNPKLFGCFAGI